MQEVAELNNIKDRAQIKPGDRIFMPGARKVMEVAGTQDTAKAAVQTENVQTSRAPGMFTWPVQGPVIKDFGIAGGLKHDGINIQAQSGSPVRVAAPGKVAFSSKLQGYGNTIIVEHNDRYATIYANNETNLVTSGQWVKRGQLIARVGSSGGQGPAPYLHFQIRQKNRPRNPLFYLPRQN